jgi:hypothetical protein
VGVLLGNGNGTFQTQQTFATGTGPQSLAVVDMNGDGIPDLVVANGGTPASQGNTLSVLLGNGNGTFQAQQNFAAGTLPYYIAVSDVNGDGRPDLVITNGGIFAAAGNTVTVLLNNGNRIGNGTFQAQQTFGTGFQPYSIAVSDVNGDGRPDLVVANEGSSSVGVLLGNGNGTFQTEQTFATGENPRFVAVADLNGDNRPDLVVTNNGVNGSLGDTVSVLLGNGNGSFQPQQTFATGTVPKAVAVADLNGDGKPDLVVVNDVSDSVSVLLGNGNGTFQAQQTFAVGSYPQSLAVADLNGDGRLDLVVGGHSVSVLLGNGNGTFQPQQAFDAGGVQRFVAVSDMNGDGRPDLVIANNNSPGTVSVLLGNGNGRFQAQQTFAAGTTPFSITASDLNGDGMPDLVVANAASNSVSVLLGNGNGTFLAQQTFATGTNPFSVAVSDVNGDGRPDLVVANYNSNTLSVLMANGNPYFIGQVYTIIPTADVINGTSNSDSFTLEQDPDQRHIDWTFGSTGGQLPINDPNGLTINGNGSIDSITVVNTNGNPFPNTLHLNGIFTLNGLQGTNPLAGTTLDIGRSTVYVSYASPASDPIAAIRAYLQSGFNHGAWNGTPTASTGAITSLAAQTNTNHNTAISYADSADAQGVNSVPETVELKYTLYGDANLDGQVNSADLQILLANLNRPGSWDQGDFNYDGQVNSADLQALLFTLNTSLGNQATPMAIAATPAVTTPQSAGGSGSSDPSQHLVPAIHPTGTTGPMVHRAHAAKVSARKRK